MSRGQLICSLLATGAVWSSSFDLNEAVKRTLRTASAFTRDRSLVGLMKGYSASAGLSRFFEEVKTVLRENPEVLTLEDAPNAVMNADRRYGSSDLPFELALAVVQKGEVLVRSGDALKPLRSCFSGAREAKRPEVDDFQFLMMYSSRLDHVNSAQSEEYWRQLRSQWSKAVEKRPELLGHFELPLHKYRAASLAMNYDKDCCGASDAQRAARMDADELHGELERLKPLLAETPLQIGNLVQLTGVASAEFRGRWGVVIGNVGLETTEVSVWVAGNWRNVRVNSGKLTVGRPRLALTPRLGGLEPGEDWKSEIAQMGRAGIASLAAIPEKLQSEAVLSAKTKLIGLLVLEKFGIQGLGDLTDAIPDFRDVLVEMLPALLETLDQEEALL